MTQTIQLNTAQARPIVAQVFPDYRGRTFKLRFTKAVTFSDIHWGGGTRNDYKFVRADGEVAYLPASVPWDSPYEGERMPLPAHVLVVKHTIFCGRDLGITIYAHPSWAPKLLEGG